MDLDNINDIELLRELAKFGRVQLAKSINADNGNYIFKEGFWYLMSQDENGVYLFSEGHKYRASLTYKAARECLRRKNIL